MAKNSNNVLGMTHLNGNLLCAICIETTGDKLNYHELCQITIIPVNYELQRAKGIMPFHCDIRPRFPDRIDFKKSTLSRPQLQRLCQHGLNSDKAAQLLEEWFDRFPLNRGKKISPLAYDWPRIYNYLCTWLGQDGAEYIFDYRYRDFLPIASFLNDYHDRKIENCPFAKQDFSHIFRCFKIERERGKNRSSLTDCMAMIKLYQAMVANISILDLTSREDMKKLGEEENSDKELQRQEREEKELDELRLHLS